MIPNIHLEHNRHCRFLTAKVIVKNIPYGSGLAGGVRNARWYDKNRKNILEYQNWVESWGKELFRILKPGALVLIFNSTRTAAHIQVKHLNICNLTLELMSVIC